MTISEKLISEANKYYLRNRIATIRKNDPRRTQRGLFTSSTGLDFSGLVLGGAYISFEVKETIHNYLLIDNIRFSQLNTMERESVFGSDPFLVVFFSRVNEWYRLDYLLLKNILELEEYSKIPIRYFKAFGKLIPINQPINQEFHLGLQPGFPDYLNCESHPRSNELKKDFPKWMPKQVERKQEIIEQENIGKIYLDPNERKKRIIAASKRGIVSAKRREEAVDVFRQRNRQQ